MLNNKCLIRIKRLLLMVILLIISYYIYLKGYQIYNDRFKGVQSYKYLKIRKDLKQIRLNSIFAVKQFFSLNIGELLFSLFFRHGNKIRESLSLDKNKHCKYLIILLDPWNIPDICISNRNEKFKIEETNLTNNSLNSIHKFNFFEHIQTKELYKNFQDKLNLIIKFNNSLLINDFENYKDLSSILPVNLNPRIKSGNYFDLLINISMNIKLDNYKCRKSVNIRKLWEFGRILCKIDKETISNCENLKYYEFISLLYYNCIYEFRNYKLKNHNFKKTNIKRIKDIDANDLNMNTLIEISTCYETIPIHEIEDEELIYLSKLCEWKYNNYLLENKYEIEEEKIRFIKDYIKFMNKIFWNSDLIDLRLKYNTDKNESNINVSNEINKLPNLTNGEHYNQTSNSNVFHTEYFNKLLKLIKVINNQIFQQYLHISEEIDKFVNSSKENRNYSLNVVNSLNNLENHSNKRSEQLTDSINWKHLFSSIIDSSQNILVREHINAMLINFAFDTIIQIFNPWISLFYQASFIINSYLSIISFLLIIAAILVCFNTIPCFKNEKDKQKSERMWRKIIRIYKVNILVVLLNIMFILGGLLSYLYLPNEMELLNSNIAIIKAMNKILNIILCPLVINIITSFSTIFSIFQWQIIWFNNKFSLSSILNL